MTCSAASRNRYTPAFSGNSAAFSLGSIGGKLTWPQNRYPLFSQANFHHTRLNLPTMLPCLTSRRLLFAALSYGLLFLTIATAARQAPETDSKKPKAKPNSSTDNATKNA